MRKVTAVEFARLFDEVRDSNETHLMCRYHGLVGRDGCEHLVSDFVSDRSMSVRGFAGPPGFSNDRGNNQPTTMRIGPGGLPLR